MLLSQARSMGKACHSFHLTPPSITITPTPQNKASRVPETSVAGSPRNISLSFYTGDTRRNQTFFLKQLEQSAGSRSVSPPTQRTFSGFDIFKKDTYRYRGEVVGERDIVRNKHVYTHGRREFELRRSTYYIIYAQANMCSGSSLCAQVRLCSLFSTYVTPLYTSQFCIYLFNLYLTRRKTY